MDDREIDIVAERIGPFAIGQKFVVPPEVASSGFKGGDSLWLDLETDHSIVLDVGHRDGRLIAEVVYLFVENPSYILLGKRLGDWRFSDLMVELRPRGVRIVVMDDYIRHLSSGASLHLCGETIEAVSLGGTSGGQITVSDPSLVAAVVAAAKATNVAYSGIAEPEKEE